MAALLGAGKPLPARRMITWDKAQRIRRNLEIWKDPSSVVHRLPEHYKHRYWGDRVLKDREPVHFRLPEYRFDWDPKKNIRIEYEPYPIVPIYPPEADRGLWGGEGVIKGFKEGKLPKRKKQLQKRLFPKLYWPKLKQFVLHSEVLDQYMKIVVTDRTCRKIDEHFGLDFYLLNTADSDLASKLGCKLKREILLSLARGADFYSDRPEQQKEILEKYKDFVIPEEEAEWVGLDLNEACAKLQDLEEQRSEAIKVPLKTVLEQELVEYLRLDIDLSEFEPGDKPTGARGFLNRWIG